MSWIPKQDAEALRQHLEARLAAPVTIDYFTQAAGWESRPATSSGRSWGT